MVTMASVREASAMLASVTANAIAENDGGLPESDAEVNNASRAVVAAMSSEHGEAWLGRINLYDGQRVKAGGKVSDVMWKWDGSLVLNFAARFVAPRFDPELVRLIRERDTAPYEGTSKDGDRLVSIFARLEEIGGKTLIWT